MLRKIFFILLSFTACVKAGDTGLLKTIGDQLLKKDKIVSGKFPVYTKDGKWVFTEYLNWFAGFTSGELWNMYDLTGNDEFKTRALAQADNLIKYAGTTNTHDLGFIFFNSCVKAYQHTGQTKYRDAAITAARTIAKRFNKKGNFIRAWGEVESSDRAGLMIIDTMMNLDLLFWAAQETGDYSFYDVAYTHAITCMNQNVRNNYSSYHVVEFNPDNGTVIKKKTHQGYADESTWARGQAWGIYGFASAYKNTKDERFLNVSRKMADYFLQALPDDMVPYWDLDLKGENVTRDASAGAIAASGMYLLSGLASSMDELLKYADKAEKITNSLTANYLFTKSKRPVEEGILLHTVYNFAKGWGVDESYPCGDFYYIECIKRQTEKAETENFIKINKIREDYLINKDWFYLEENITDPGSLHSTGKEWTRVNLPHTWNVSDALDQEPGYRRGIGWYQKEILIPAEDKNVIYNLHFEGVNNKCEVFINGKKAGAHVGGYVGFDVDITSYVIKGKKNQILVKADNSFDPYLVPSQKSDFILYGGITRNVHLQIIPSTHISSLKIQTPEVTEKKAVVKINFSIEQLLTDGDYKLEAVVKDNDGKTVANKEIKIKDNKAEQTLPEIKNPILWSPENPYLYTVELTLKKSNVTVDQISDRFGCRWYEFKEHGAFYLNGKRLLLRGTHRHEELAGYGNALPDSLHRKDIKMIKEMGANFVRLAHYPQALEVYRACDELGLLVWDENPWCRGGVGPVEWQQNTKRIFKEMINQNYNHPSIILWSIGNECDWLPDFPGGENTDTLSAFAGELHKLAKELDHFRYTTTRKFPQAKDVVDVFSPSIWSGWYSDVYKNYEKTITKARDTYKRFIHAEYGGDSHVGRHSETPINGEGKVTQTGGEEQVNKLGSGTIANIGDWSENYIVDLFDWYLRVTETSDWLTGSAQWIFRDFTTPLRPENPIPYVNQKGLVDMNNSPKDAYYVFKSYWNSTQKFCYIESHTWTERNGKKDELKELNVFSNCSDVELFVNGVSQGKLQKDINKYPASGLSWHVKFSEGENKITSIGYTGTGKVAADSMTVNYTSAAIGKAEDLTLKQKRLSDGSYLITALAVDKNGRQCTDFNKRVYFTVLSGGKFTGLPGTPTGSEVIEMANGKAQILFRHIPQQKGVIEVRNQDFKGTYITIE